MMRFLTFVGSSIFQVLSFIFVLGFLLGILNIHFSDKNEYCAMTYMFEYPQFVRVSVPENNIYPQYGLYAYSEGRFTERARKMWFDGVPVLFLPGNSGSHMQARSLASVALRKALTGNYEYHFDFFTIAYNEELSGLYGGVLQSQTNFAAACISRILSLYKSNRYTKSVPTSVILIGHSMGGVIAKRLLAYPQTMNSTLVAITLAAPLEAPVMNFDIAINDYYKLMGAEWDEVASSNIGSQKILLSFGNGPRDFLMPSSLTSSKESYINALTTAVPGVWVSPDHVGIVWCKQLVMAINKYLFDIVDPQTEQVSENKQLLTVKAKQYFQANRSMTLSPTIIRPNVAMVADAFWYEDNRRIYRVSRPDIDKTTYLMIRLLNYAQNRFVAVETVNVTDKDWVFGCNAMFTYNTYRYCKQGTSLTELSRWTGAAVDFGKRKLATINLHSIKQQYPDWTHVVFKVSPTRKPVILNVDINDYASRQITIELPSIISFGTTLVKQETEPSSLYYELILPEFNTVHQAYLLYVEPTASCKASQYHVSAEVHVPWAKNNEYYHYFTHIKRSPMKLRLYKSNPNITYGLETTEHVKVTLLLDPQCTFTISIASSWYHRLAQIARNYTLVLTPYVAAIVLLAARSNILHLKDKGRCITIHSALMSEGVKPYYALVCARLLFTVVTSVPLLAYLLENASWRNIELMIFSKSLLVIPAYMAALGALHIAAAAVLAVMVFSSQLAHRLLFRIMWRGGSNIAEKVASSLQRVPLIVSVSLMAGIPLSCGAASLVAGAAFYAFMLSKMYEEYLEDYVYKIMAKVASKMCRWFTSKKTKDEESETALVCKETEEELTTKVEAIEYKIDSTEANSTVDSNKVKDSKENSTAESSRAKDTKANTVENSKVKDAKANTVESSKVKEENSSRVISTKENTSVITVRDTSKQIVPVVRESLRQRIFRRHSKPVVDKKETQNEEKVDRRKTSEDLDEELNNLNFHMTLFFMWMSVTLVNVPALLTWARNFKYSMVLKPDTSYHVGMVMSACSSCLWQMSGPRRNLKYYDAVAALLFTMAVCIIVLGPFSLATVSYGVTFMYVVITAQQLFDREVIDPEATISEDNKKPENRNNVKEDVNCETNKAENVSSEPTNEPTGSKTQTDSNDSAKSDANNPTTEQNSEVNGESSEDCVCNENRIYTMFKNLREKFNFSED